MRYNKIYIFSFTDKIEENGTTCEDYVDRMVENRLRKIIIIIGPSE